MDSGQGLPGRLRAAREAHGLSQSALGALIGVTQAAVGKFETGTAAPTYATAAKLAAALEVSPGWLVFGEGPEPRWPKR